MKLIKRALSWLLVVCLLLSVPICAPAEAAEDSAVVRYGRNKLAAEENGEALLCAYDTMVQGLYDTQSTISLNCEEHPVTVDEMKLVFDIITRDYPEFFWVSGKYGYSYSGNMARYIKPDYHMTGSNLRKAQEQLEAQVQALTADLQGKSDYEKSLLLHNRVAQAASYVDTGYHQTAYGALIGGYAVCAGYARAYQLLLNRVGIPSWYVTGESYAPGSSTAILHGWNLVQLDGEWYYTDVTWDDQRSYTFYAYLNMTEQQMWEDHILKDYLEYMPEATSTEHNYFYRNNLVTEEFDTEFVADVIRNHNPFRFYVVGNRNQFIKDYYTKLYDLLEELNAPPAGFSYGSASIGNEVILILEIEHTCDMVYREVPATCFTPGYSQTKCAYEFCHKGTDPVEIPAIGQHTYDNACDFDCGVCGEVREVGDHAYESEVTAEPSCGNSGEIRYTCAACGHSYTEFVPPSGEHVYDTDCDTDCNVCGTLREADGHAYTSAVTTPATCGDDGVKTYTCTACGDSYTETIPATGEHTYLGTCDYTCANCDSINPDGGHKLVTVPYKEPTCQEPGNREYEYCTRCGIWWVGEIMYGDYWIKSTWLYHDYVFVPAVEATCQTPGNIAYVYCTVCHQMLDDMMENGVSPDEIITYKDHTYDHACDADCNDCGEVREVGDHLYDNACDATCNACGVIREVGDHVYDDGCCDRICNNCGYERLEDLHVYDNHCDRICNNCGYERGPQGDHAYDEQEIKPTCGTDGSRTYTCTICGYCFTESIPATGNHNYELTATIHPTCGTAGQDVYTCTVCDDTYAEELDATGNHTYQAAVTIQPTCGAPGVLTHTCTVCGDAYTEVIPATGSHVYRATVTTPATCGNDGVKTYTCTVCGHFFTEILPATGNHVYDGDPDTDCNVCGAIRENVTYTPGDISGDNTVDMRDLTTLQRFLAHWKTVSYVETALDVNGDGSVNLRDITHLQRYLAHWEGVELY